MEIVTMYWILSILVTNPIKFTKDWTEDTIKYRSYEECKTKSIIRFSSLPKQDMYKSWKCTMKTEKEFIDNRTWEEREVK